MGFKEILARAAEKAAEKKKKFREMEEQYLMEKKLMEKQKSSNQRELERYLKEKEEARIKKELEYFREKQRDETWRSGASILKNDFNVMHSNNPILKDKIMFELKSKVLGGKKLFFK